MKSARRVTGEARPQEIVVRLPRQWLGREPARIRRIEGDGDRRAGFRPFGIDDETHLWFRRFPRRRA